ncbi:MAG: ATP phosphoribosyltransferase regulatory subunit, partial [Clostridia bacterium]|nr:ATP phosphoribosyltransferase regulatory subunit [Clostridia bacterium]
PACEYAALFDAGLLNPRNMVRFVDRQGEVLALRPDWTLPAARVCAALPPQDDPYRLCYVGPTYEIRDGLLCENPQAGVELINKEGTQGDVEILQLAAASLKQAGLSSFVLELGHAGFFAGLCAEAGLCGETQENVRRATQRKDALALEWALSEIDGPLKEKLMKLPTLYGGAEVVAQACALTKSPQAHAALDALTEIHKSMGDSIAFDLGLAPRFGYYTGVTIQGLAPGAGRPVLFGGRYDNLLSRFGRELPAVGFSINISQLLAAMGGNCEG